MRIRIMLMVFAAMCAVDAVAQSASALKDGQRFLFRPGQSVYVTAVHTVEHVPRRSSPAAWSMIDHHLPAELRIRKDFEKQRVYTLVDKASEADFVFFVLIDDSAAEGLAISPQVFAEHRNQPNIEALREAAYVRATIGPLKIHSLSRISERLVRRFHEEEGVVKPAS